MMSLIRVSAAKRTKINRPRRHGSVSPTTSRQSGSGSADFISIYISRKADGIVSQPLCFYGVRPQLFERDKLQGG
jgi:hypothetical protein